MGRGPGLRGGGARRRVRRLEQKRALPHREGADGLWMGPVGGDPKPRTAQEGLDHAGHGGQHAY